MKYSEIKVGDKFIRTDKYGRQWIAEVINRTEYFVDVLKYSPRKVKVADENEVIGWKWEQERPEQERCEIIPEMIQVQVGTYKGLLGKDYPKYEYQNTGNYGINCKIWNTYYMKHIDYGYQWEYNK